MLAFEHALILILLTTALSVIARWLPWPSPITFVIGAVGASYLPGIPRVDLDPGFFFLFFVPPLIFSDGWLTSLREFMAAKRPIFLLATGLVSFTTLLVGYVAHWMLPELSLPMAFALGAVISPTDAVAVSAITERLKVPTRLTTILEGESLMNDATALVAFKFALAAAVVGTFSLKAAAVNFVFVATGGLLIGLLVAYAVGKIRDLLRRVHGSDALVETTLSLLTPYAAYLAAESLHVSDILAVVSAGLYSGWRDPVKMDVEARQTTWAVWSVILYWLNGLAFVLLGLQFPAIISAVRHVLTPAQMFLFVGIISAVAIVARIAWFFPGAYLPFVLSKRVRSRERKPAWQAIFIGGWAGMRGTVTLAAAMSIPLALGDGKPFPGRDLVVFLALGVIMVTLLLQGTTLEWLIHKLGLHEDDTLVREDRLARITAVQAGLNGLRSLSTNAENPEESAALGVVVSEYEHRLAELTAEGETKASAKRRRTAGRRHRLHALRAERTALEDLWRRNVINDETHRPLQQLLDHEEAMLLAQPESTEH